MEVGYKGAPLVLVRTWVREKSLEEKVTSNFDPTEKELFATFLATDWVPVAFAAKVYVEVAPLLYPGETLALRRIGAEIAKANVRGVLRFVLRTMTVPFLVQQTARVWRMFHLTGNARMERKADHALCLYVCDYPELSAPIRETICGYLAELVERTGARGVSVRQSDQGGPGCWCWAVTWR